jgi:creatinine amidohydrolase
VNLQTATSQEVEDYLRTCTGIILPTGSLEQHGPVGLIGTDAICVETIALRAAEYDSILVAPVLNYAPAQFNLGFAGTISLSAQTFSRIFTEITTSLMHSGFDRIYVLNGHGANLAPLRSAVHDLYLKHDEAAPRVKIRNWWDFPKVNALREELYGEWEGLHGTPSEVAITQYAVRTIKRANASPPQALSADDVREAAGDYHGPASEHRRTFSDGRVGSFSELAERQHGEQIVTVAADSLIAEFRGFVKD